MRLLIITQATDSKNQVLGFFVSWINEFAKQFDFVTIICLEKGEFDLPKNVKVLSLGKEEGQSRLKYLLRFYRYIWQERKNYDVVFVHMNPIYVLLGGLYWRLQKKIVTLWYAHKHISFSLRVATLLSHQIFSSSEEGFRIKTSKGQVVGQGIVPEHFVFNTPVVDGEIELLSFGRISDIKKTKKSLEILKEVNTVANTSLTIIGDAITKNDFLYREELIAYVHDNNLGAKVHFLGSIPYSSLQKELKGKHFLLHTSQTGSMDKTVLECLLSGIIVLSESLAFKDFLSKINTFLLDNSVDSYKNKILLLSKDTQSLGQKAQMGRDWVLENHTLINLISKIKYNIIEKYESHS